MKDLLERILLTHQILQDIHFRQPLPALTKLDAEISDHITVMSNEYPQKEYICTECGVCRITTDDADFPPEICPFDSKMIPDWREG